MSRYGKCCSKISLKNVLFPQKIKETSNRIFPFFSVSLLGLENLPQKKTFGIAS
jgi:hypothetical protein